MIHQALPVHVGRTAGCASRDHHGPRYGLDEHGELVRLGRLRRGPELLEKAINRLEKPRVFSHCHALLHPQPEHVDLWVAVVDESRRLIEERFPGCAFEVILWDDADNWLTDRMRSGLNDRRIRVHSIHDILLDLTPDHSGDRLSENDSHANAAAEREIADYVTDHVLDRSAGQGPPDDDPRRSRP